MRLTGWVLWTHPVLLSFPTPPGRARLPPVRTSPERSTCRPRAACSSAARRAGSPAGTAWLAVLAGDIDDVREHVALEEWATGN